MTKRTTRKGKCGAAARQMVQCKGYKKHYAKKDTAKSYKRLMKNVAKMRRSGFSWQVGYKGKKKKSKKKASASSDKYWG